VAVFLWALKGLNLRLPPCEDDDQGVSARKGRFGVSRLSLRPPPKENSRADPFAGRIEFRNANRRFGVLASASAH